MVINATGAFTDSIRKLDEPKSAPLISPSQGTHLVLDRHFLPSDYAILIPKTADGRVVFFVPWYERLIIGTTDTPVDSIQFEPRPLATEIDFLLQYTSQYLTSRPKRSDVLSVFTGLRPLVQSVTKKKTKSLSRSHYIQISDAGLLTICGGKWTTYRKMAEDVIDQAISNSDLTEVPCKTSTLRLHGYEAGLQHCVDAWNQYGSNAAQLKKLVEDTPELGKKLHSKLPYTQVEVVWAVRKEMARTLEDVLSRRTRSLLLDARIAIEIAPTVAHLMAVELGKSVEWEMNQVKQFTELASGYLPR